MTAPEIEKAVKDLKRTIAAGPWFRTFTADEQVSQAEINGFLDEIVSALTSARSLSLSAAPECRAGERATDDEMERTAIEANALDTVGRLRYVALPDQDGRSGHFAELTTTAANIIEALIASASPPSAEGWQAIETARKWLTENFSDEGAWWNSTAMEAVMKLDTLLEIKPPLPAHPLLPNRSRSDGPQIPSPQQRYRRLRRRCHDLRRRCSSLERDHGREAETLCF